MSSVEHLYRQYPEQWGNAAWMGDVLDDMDYAGFNSLGAGPDAKLRETARRPYTLIAWMAECMTTSDAPDDYISPTKHHAACTGFPNVFSSEWPSRARAWAKRMCAPVKDDPFLVGWYLDNELKWWGTASFGDGSTGLFDAVAALPRDHSARRALESFVAQRGTTVSGASDAVRRGFVADAARRFFTEACAAVREADPNHLLLGVRFAGLTSAPDSAWRMCGEHCDVVSFNVYPWVDLDSVTFSTDSPGFAGRDLRKTVELRHRQAGGRPMVVSEWGFSALDSGLSCLRGSGQRFHTQAERAKATELVLREFVSWPFLVGCSWFRYMDMDPKEGDGEDCNYGLVSRKGRRYLEVMNSFRHVHSELYSLRGVPSPRLQPSKHCKRGMRANEVMRRIHTAGQSGFVFNASSAKAAALSYDGTDCGTFGPMVCHVEKNGRERWLATAVPCSHGFRSDGSCAVTNRISQGEMDLRIAMRLRFIGGGYMLAELESVENAGRKPVVLRRFYFRNEPPFVREATAENEPLDGRRLWKAISASAWIAPDGFYIGAMSAAPLASTFGYSVRNNGASVHPDAAFAFDRRCDLSLEPDAVWRSEGRIWAVFAAGRGGVPAWRDVRDGFRRNVAGLKLNEKGD